MPLRKQNDLTPVPLQGGMTTVRDISLLQPGSFSLAQNVRPKHPGFIKRKGQTALHGTADSTNKVVTLSQFRKIRINETHTFAQMSDGDILEATSTPPTVATGAVWGTEVFSGTGSDAQNPACWAVLDDLLVHTNGVDPAKIYAGSQNYPLKVVVYTGTATIPKYPVDSATVTNIDYTEEATDGSASTVVVLDSIGTDSDQGLMICCPVQANRLYITVSAANGNAVTMNNLSYMRNTGVWTDASETDGTASGGATLAVSGVVSWSAPSDEMPSFYFGECGYWYYIQFSGALDAEVELSSITYGTDGAGTGTRTSFLSLQNRWDGLDTDPVEVQVYNNTESVLYTYGAYSVNLGAEPLDENGYILVWSIDPLHGIYIDVGSTPNTADATALSVNSWTTAGWAGLTELDGTAGLTKSGWITWGYDVTTEIKKTYAQHWQLYCYKITVDDAVSDDIIATFNCRPAFHNDNIGNGVACCSWQNRMAYAFDKWGQYVYISKTDQPNVLNGLDFGVVEAGDGRANQVLAMGHIYNDMIVWQEERGIDGGCTTIIEGYNPRTYGKLVLSSKIGILNSKCHTTIDGVLTSTASEEKLKTLVFWISRYGVCVSDGRVISLISDPIQNYFDPQETECIRKGYEDQHWLTYDSTYNILRMGLVSGSSATVPNVFFAFDLVDKCWYKDVLAQELSCATEVEAGSGNVHTIQIGGGTDDGFIYHLNNGYNDVNTAVTSILDLELHAFGETLNMGDFLLQCAVQAAGSITLTVYVHGIAGTQQFSETFSMTAADTGDKIRRHLEHYNVTNQHITVRLSHATASQNMDLYNLGIELYIWDGV